MYEVANRFYVLRRYFRISAESKVLHFGCAEGLAFKRLYSVQRFEYYGIDCSDKLLAAALINFPEGSFFKIDKKGELPFENGFFDFVAACGVLQRIPHVRKRIFEPVRVTKAGGLCALGEPVFDMGRPVGSRKAIAGLGPNERDSSPFPPQHIVRAGR